MGIKIMAINIFPKTPFGKAMILKPPEPSSQPQSQKTPQQVSVPDYSYLKGKRGITIYIKTIFIIAPVVPS